MEHHNDFISNREVRIFISSTFLDMKECRDEIVNILIPNLRHEFEGMNITINAIDLRWGITDDDVINGHVMDICFNEIEKCRPFFVGIIGDRYGSPISLSQIRNNPKTQPYIEQIEKQYSKYELSATELEMQYGVLLKNPNSRMASYFLIKEKKDSPKRFLLNRFKKAKDKDYKKIQNLINKIEKRAEAEEGIKVIKYTNFTTARIELENYLSLKIREYFSNLSWNEYDSILSYQRSRISALNKIRYPLSSTDYESINDFVNNSDKQILAIYSKDEIMNVFLANWITKYENSIKIIPFFPYTTNNINALIPGEFIHDSLVRKEEKTLNNEYKDPFKKAKIWDEVETLIRKHKSEKIVIVLPNIDNNDCLQHYIVTLVNKLKRINLKSLKVIVSHNEQTRIDRFQNNPSVETLQLCELSNVEQKQMLVTYLQPYGKDNGLAKGQEELLSNIKIPITGFASFLDYLSLFSNHDIIDIDISDLFLYSKSNKSVFDLLFDKIEQSMSQSEVMSFQEALSFICLSYNGLPEMDLMEMCENLSFLDLIKIENVFSFQFVHCQGRITIVNTKMSDVIRRRYLKNKENDLRLRIVDYYTYKRSYMAYDELLYQYTMLHDYENIYRLVGRDKETISHYIRIHPWDYVEKWELLWMNDRNKYTISILEKTFSNITSLSELYACNYVRCFVHYYCSYHQLVHQLTHSMYDYRDNSIPDVYQDFILKPVLMREECKLLNDEHSIKSIIKAIDTISNAITKFTKGKTIIGMSCGIELYTNMGEQIRDMYDLQEKMIQDLKYLEDKEIINDDLIKANQLHKKALYLLGISHNPQAVLPLFLESFQLKEKNGADEYERIRTATEIGRCFFILGDYNNAIRYYEKSCNMVKKTRGEHDYLLLNMYVHLSLCYLDLCKNDKAQVLLEKAEEIEEQSPRPHHELINHIRLLKSVI